MDNKQIQNNNKPENADNYNWHLFLDVCFLSGISVDPMHPEGWSRAWNI